MFEVLVVALLFLVHNYGIRMAMANRDGDFFHNCPPSRCGEGRPEIRFPFRLVTSPPSCGAPGMELSCSREKYTVLLHPVLGLCNVTSIDYRYGQLNVIPLEKTWSQCPLQKIISITNLSTSVYRPYKFGAAILFQCSREFIPNKDVKIVGPISCISNASQVMYLMSSFEIMSLLPEDCKVVLNGISMPYPIGYDVNDWHFQAKRIIMFAETTLIWSVPNITGICQDCEQKGHLCGFSSQRRQAFCERHGTVSNNLLSTKKNLCSKLTGLF